MEGPVIVTGGAGYFGYHLIKALLVEPGCRPIISINRNPKDNLHEGVDYRAGSIADEDFVRKLMDETQPRIIYHVASPTYECDYATAQKSGVDATRILLKVARQCTSVKAFVYTSSVGVAAGMVHCNIDESAPTWAPDARCNHYHKAKAIAERDVLAANCDNLRTVSVRLCLILGERDQGFISRFLDAFEKGQNGYQIGNNTNLFCTVSAENAAMAHILATKALMDPSRASQKVDGETFIVTDGNPMPFWDITRMVSRAAGDTPDPKNVTVIPAWVAYKITAVLEILYAVFTLGMKKPMFSSQDIDYLVSENTYNIEKAKRILGYRPVVRIQEVVNEAVEWELKKREREKAAKKSR